MLRSWCKISFMKSYHELNSSEKKYYSLLLLTKEWIEVRSKQLEKANYTCVLCKEKANWDIHVGGIYGYLVYNLLVKEDQWGIPRPELELKKVENPLVLHLHHTYYVRNTTPWEYPDECFQVLCKNCHENEHKNKKFRMYASHELGQSQHLTPCKKCSGSGYLPHYHYYEDGVCFGCNGAGFEELKNSFNPSTFDLNLGGISSSDNEEDDLPF